MRNYVQEIRDNSDDKDLNFDLKELSLPAKIFRTFFFFFTAVSRKDSIS